MSLLFNPPGIIAILIALTVHEWAHGIVAYRLGDPTAKYEGRLTFNPIAHLDPIGTVMFLMVGFGWGKPVPVNPRFFKNIRRDSALVSLAGPLSNLVLAFIAFFGLKLIAPQFDVSSAFGLLSGSAGSGISAFVVQVLASSLFINLGLMAFNLLPIAPLDGSKIVSAFIPYQHEDSWDRLMQYGPYILLGLLIMERVVGFPLLQTWILAIINPILNLMMAIG